MAGREGSNLGPYRLTRLLGAGGAGEVYLAEGPTPSGQPGQVAVKVLHGAASDPAARGIAQQVHALSSLHLTHVLPVYAVAEAAGSLYIAMAYAPAGSLALTLGAPGAEHLQLPLGAGTVARLVGQVARALQPLHEQGTVHGDLKLSNLFVRTSPQGGPLAALGDFGQAAVLSAALAAAGRGTADPRGMLASAVRCAAPEQLAGQHLPASDQYALATIAYLLLTGHYPFEGDAAEVLAALPRAPVTPPTQHDSTIPLPAEAALLRALAKDPGTRFPDIATFAQALSDGLASAVLSGNASQQFMRLAGGPPGASYAQRRQGALAPRATASLAASPAGPTASGIRRTVAGAPAASGVRRIPAAQVGAPPVPGGASRQRASRQRIVAIAAGGVILMLGLVGVLGLRALAGGSRTTLAPLPNFGGLNYAPTITPNATTIARTHERAASGLATMSAASRETPVFSDSLRTNAQHWPVDGKQFFFGTDGKLHGTNTDSRSVATLEQPATAPANYLVTVNLTFLKGTPSDVAGIQVRVAASAAGAESRYMVLIAPEGRFEVWYFDGGKWSNLDNGYANPIKRGLNVSNTLQVLCANQEIWLFVNGQFVTNVHDFTPPGVAGSLGPAVVYTTTEVTYDSYNVYPVNS